MLMNLLPGLRDLRAPLAAGYLWLTGLWLLLADTIPSRSKATGVMAHIYTLTNALGRGTILLAASFAAYLIGAVLSVDSDGPIVGLLMFRGNLFRRNSRLAIGIERFYPDYYRVASGRISQKVLGDVIARVMRLKEVAVIDNDTLKAIEQPTATEATEEWNIVAQTFYDPDQLLSPVRNPSGTPWAVAVWRCLPGIMLSNLVREVRQLVTQLRVSSPPLFDQYDRARGEAEFRISVSFPLIFITGILAWKWTPLWLLLLFGVVLIMLSGLRRAREATDTVAQAALAGFVTPTGWSNPKSNPLVITREILNTVLRAPDVRFDDYRSGNDSPRSADRIQAMLQFLPAAPPQTDAPASQPGSPAGGSR